MPRVGSRSEDRSEGAGFRFEGTHGRIMDARVVNHTIPNVATSCCWELTILPLDTMWRPTGADTVKEFVSFGDVDKFHPGRAQGSEDKNPELEWGRGLDSGAADGAEGTCVISQSGAGPNGKKGQAVYKDQFAAKINVFSQSCEDHGVRPDLFNGYAPNVIGMEATFTQFIMKQQADQAKRAVTCLIVGTNGNPTGGTINRYPDAQTGVQSAKVVPLTQRPALPAANQAPAQAPAPPPAAAATAPNGAAINGAATDEDVETATVRFLKYVQKQKPGQMMLRSKIKSMLTLYSVDNNISDSLNKLIGAEMRKDEWFTEMASALGWKLEGDNVTFPA